MNVETAVVILNYKTPELTIDCLASIQDQVEDGLAVIVVDNNSDDGSPDRIEESILTNGWDDWCRLIRSDVNGGFAAGNNIGIRAVEADAYILLNSDTIVRDGAFRALRRAMQERPDVGLFAPRIEKANGELDQNTFRYITPISELIRSADTGPVTRLLKSYEVPIPARGEPFEPEWVGFACVLIRKAVFDEIGLLDDEFFMYFEDVEYCHRARSAGWRILYWPEARIIHLLGGSSGVTKKGNHLRRPPRYFYESRSKYFKKAYGRSAALAANLLWTAGRGVSLLREKYGAKQPFLREQEFYDIWTEAFPRIRGKGREKRGAPLKRSPAKNAPPSATLNDGSTNCNPADLGFFELLLEDMRTYDLNPLDPGFLAVATHRFGNWRMDIPYKLLRAPFTILYTVGSTWISWFWGIDIGYPVKLGRRVRIWHHGGIWLGAKSIGDDVTIRHGTTFGLMNQQDLTLKPIIEDRVDIGTGVCVLGDVTVGHDSVIGANSVVVRNVEPHTTVFGVPARRVNLVLASKEKARKAQ